MTKEAIIKLFEQDSELTVKEITDRLLVSKQMVHLVLNQLLEKGIVIKLGRTPKTVYRLAPSAAKSIPSNGLINSAESESLQQNFLLITETGELKEGLEGFTIWCNQRKLPLVKTVGEFIETNKKYKAYFNEQGVIDGMEKLVNTKGYTAIHLNNLHYLDFYAIERFGKTKLGTLLHYAKQGQSKFLMKRMVNEIGNRISAHCTMIQADGVCFVPPTIRREVQLMKFIQTQIPLSVPKMEVKKISGLIPVPQKSLTKIEERIANAQNTFAVVARQKFKHILLIDDAVGSGATVNEIAGKLKQKGVSEKVSALAITGSFKGFDVITDV